MCFLSNNIYDYVNVSQGKITVPGMDDGEECQAMDVSLNCPKSLLLHLLPPLLSHPKDVWCIQNHQYYWSLKVINWMYRNLKHISPPPSIVRFFAPEMKHDRYIRQCHERQTINSHILSPLKHLCRSDRPSPRKPVNKLYLPESKYKVVQFMFQW